MILTNIYDDIYVNAYGIKHNKAEKCVMHRKDDKWIVESVRFCSEQGTECTVYMSIFAVVVALSSKTYLKPLIPGGIICGN